MRSYSESSAAYKYPNGISAKEATGEYKYCEHQCLVNFEGEKYHYCADCDTYIFEYKYYGATADGETNDFAYLDRKSVV